MERSDRILMRLSFVEWLLKNYHEVKEGIPEDALCKWFAMEAVFISYEVRGEI